MYTLQKLWPWCFIMAFFTVISCQEPDDIYMNESTSQGKSKIISLEELKVKPKAYEKINRIIGNQHNLSKNTSAYDDNYGVTIVTDQILLYEDSGYESLTFSVYPDEDRGLVENIILVKEQDGEYTAYYMMYDFTEQEKQRLEEGENITFDHPDYSGIPLDEFDNGIVMKSGGNDGIIRRDGKCYKVVLRRVEVYSNIPGQKEFGKWEVVEIEVGCPEEDPDHSYTDGDYNGGGGVPPIPHFDSGATPYNPGSLPGSYTGPGHSGSNPVMSSPVRFLKNKKECKKINDHMNGLYDLRDKLADLATKVNETNERGFGMSPYGNVNEFNNNLPNGDIEFTTGPGMVYNVISHTHTAGKLSVFSFDDLVSIARWIRGGYISDQTNNLIVTLSTQKGTHYVLTINDMTKFKDFFFYKTNYYGALSETDQPKYSASEAKGYELNRKYYHVDNNRIMPDESDNEKTLMEFLKFMNEANLGVSLFETDASFQSFTELSLSFFGSKVVRDECN